MPETSRVALRICGRVQGVGFRYTIRDQARRLGVAGWVRNTSNGDVELVAEGAVDRLQRLVTLCRSGPPGAVVTRVEENWSDATKEFADFRIRF